MIGARGRFRSPSAVVGEMAGLIRLGFRRIRIEDDLFTFQRERALAICREVVHQGLDVGWRAYARVDTVDPELLEWMGRAGCERVLFGAESGSPEILRRIRKGITPEQTRKAVEMCRKAGIGVLASFVLGLPGETPQTLRQTLDFARSLRVPYTLNLLTPYVGTELWEEAEKWGIRILSNDWRLYDQGKPLTATPTLGPWHLARAVGEYRRELKGYLEHLLAQEHNGAPTRESAEKLEHYRRWRFLRKLIGEEILERYGSHIAGAGEGGIEGLAKGLVPYMGMEIEEVRGHLHPLIEGGTLSLISGPTNSKWTWAT